MKIVAFDIEATNLKANFGRLLCVSFAPIPEGKIYTFKVDNKKGDDKALAKKVRDELEKYDMWITFNGKMFDIPFVNTRLIMNNERVIQKRFHADLMYYCRRPFLNLHSGRLESVIDSLKLEAEKTKLDPDLWVAARHGDPKAMRYVIEHCEQDVLALRELWPRILPFVKNLHY